MCALVTCDPAGWGFRLFPQPLHVAASPPLKCGREHIALLSGLLLLLCFSGSFTDVNEHVNEALLDGS